ncbi:Elongator subunit ELP6 KNAG_0E01200 [Huiozyma naganishii CBS 8797]|uniref:Elongator complex protein 6 n=1 Tax=Huiozyma naganishii (strain ATCC MYA-139 / BCRC 22969 / CBS 8797 / KCTC 17520 / NBRC 10181 / NCYC 3082 / Yp74L-3) TaxID=1071383 RepID=J7RYX0_HUIN7|nr:hypothetical protein KNAG_0E01200 [Kazachstania naganishii CBS 8797]CCK70387.1 hypothetical protein KNAG_0E01200 [Kazachstania naganishii CBS 8797]
MPAVQRQELVLYSDHSVFGDVLLDGSHRRLACVTATMAAQPLWLLAQLVEAATSVNRGGGGSAAASSVVVASFAHDATHFQAALQRAKVPPTSCLVVDWLTDFVVGAAAPSRVAERGGRIKWLHALLEEIPPVAPVSGDDHRSMVLLEQPEVLLSLIEGLTADELLHHFILPLQRRCGLLVVCSAVDPAGESPEGPHAVEWRRFVTSLLYMSTINLQLQPLATGHARDVTGVLHVTKGAMAPADGVKTHCVEASLFYLTEKDSTKLFYN